MKNSENQEIHQDANSASVPCFCPLHKTMSMIGGKYKTEILWNLMEHGTLRYSELHRYMPSATDKMLAQQLRELERDELITRTVYPVVPPRTEYALTAFGESLIPILDTMCEWGSNYLSIKQKCQKKAQ